ncbi:MULTISPECIES: hypothetical protein [Elizabethkingia]|uniref:hypothetical protein n=1 Tax=Elizabethkingia TaxID=308865 RepID=UPI001E34183B|nr:MULTISPECIES: hypothetical protein [Elizabethkingia]MDX8577156.1 hypothetical protein [Elizabethkingia sp. HX WYD]
MKKLTRSALKKTIGNGQKGPYLPEEWTGYCPNDCDEIENICIGGKAVGVLLLVQSTDRLSVLYVNNKTKPGRQIFRVFI